MVNEYKITCPCMRGYVSRFVLNKERVPIAFSVQKGYLIIRGYCDVCKTLVQYSVTLADLLTEEAPWTSSTVKKV